MGPLLFPLLLHVLRHPLLGRKQEYDDDYLSY